MLMDAKAQSTSLVSMVERWVIGGVGLALLSIGIVSSFIISGGTAPAAMLALGVGLVLFGMLGNRLASMRLGGLEVQLVRAHDLASMAEVEVEKGNLDQAAAYRAEALAYLTSTSLLPLANRYESIRRSMPGSPSRTAMLETLLTEVRTLARQRGWTPEEVTQEFAKGSEGERIAALAILEELPALHVFSPIKGALTAPRSNMEQYHALVAAEASIPYLTTEERKTLRSILHELDGTVGGDRQRVLKRVLAALDAIESR
jgi:hypothetical protein